MRPSIISLSVLAEQKAESAEFVTNVLKNFPNRDDSTRKKASHAREGRGKNAKKVIRAFMNFFNACRPQKPFPDFALTNILSST